MRKPRVLEICAGAGGQALGLEQAGFEHAGLAEIDPDACDTLRANRPGWKVIEGDIRDLNGRQYRPWNGMAGDIDLLAGGVPCQPFSVGGRRLGAGDDRDLFQQALRLVHEIRPRAVMLENVPGLAQPRFRGYRQEVIDELRRMEYGVRWNIVRSHMHGVPQNRPRLVLVALRGPALIRGYAAAERVALGDASGVPWPLSLPGRGSLAPTAGMALYDLMAANGWEGAYDWAVQAGEIAPTIVGGSKKHGGPDLGPTRTRNAWRRLGVEGKSLADEAPGPGFEGMPRLTLPMVARLQGFPDGWQLCGTKTARYRQVGNAFPPPVARAFGEAIMKALSPR